MDNAETPDTVAVEPYDDEGEASHDAEGADRRGPGLWGILLVLVIVFGYLTAARRASLGKFAEQVADIVQDFRGYDPEF